MQHILRVDGAGLHAVAARWDAAAGDLLSETAAPPTPGLSWQPSLSAVSAAHGAVASFRAKLAMRIGTRATSLAEADRRYASNEGASAAEFAAVAAPVTTV